MINQNGEMDLRAWVVLIGGFLATIISLSVILGWRFEASVGTRTQELRKEIEVKYVMKDVFDLHIKMIDEKLRSIMRAVGARESRQPTEVP